MSGRMRFFQYRPRRGEVLTRARVAILRPRPQARRAAPSPTPMPFRLPRRPRSALLGLCASGLVLGLSLAWPLPANVDPAGAVVSVRVTDRHGELLREVRPDGRGRP